MSHNFFKAVLSVCLVAIFLLPLTGFTQTQETPPDSPQPAATQAPAPANEPQPARQQPAQQPARRSTPASRPSRDFSPTITVEPLEEKPLHANVAVYVGGGCFLVVFIGLYMIMSSSPTSGAKRLRKRKEQ